VHKLKCQKYLDLYQSIYGIITGESVFPLNQLNLFVNITKAEVVTGKNKVLQKEVKIDL
jgi:hypothetical protein